MRYLWTEDQGAGLHFWQLVNQYLFQGELVVESKGSNQGLLDAVRELVPGRDDCYYLAFDMVYDNVDVVNKLLELQEIAAKYPEQIKLMDITCFEYIIFSFDKLIPWTGNGHKDVIAMRQHILGAVKNHRIDLDSITDEKTLKYLAGFRQFSTERVIKSITYMLTDGDDWSVKGAHMGSCWYKNCCVLKQTEKRHCNLGSISGDEKILALLTDEEMCRITSDMVSHNCLDCMENNGC